MTDIEKIYNRAKEQNIDVSLVRASEDLGFYPDLDFFVIVGKSNLGEMLLYQEDGDGEFVFTCVYNRLINNREATHWHPDDEEKAFEDLVLFMRNGKAN